MSTADLTEADVDLMFEVDANRKKWCVCGHPWIEHDVSCGHWDEKEGPRPSLCRCAVFSERPPPSE